MSLRLMDHLENSLTHQQLLDPSLRLGPEPKNPWAVFCGWCFDWTLAFALAQLGLNAWMAFLGPLGFDSLPYASHQVVVKYGEALRLVLVPVFFFAVSYVGITFHGMTPGLRLFKHSVKSRSHSSALRWAFGATVSVVTFGFPLLNHWLDEFAESETRSQRHQYWLFTKAQHSANEDEKVWNLVEMSTGTPADEEDDFQQAA